MGRHLVKTKINGKSVELGLNDGTEIISGPKVEVLGVADPTCTPEEIKDIHVKVSKIDSKIPKDVDVIDYIEGLQEKTEKTEEKEWWESKTIWVNVSAILMMVLSLFGFNFHIDPEILMLIASIVVPAINVWLRNKTCKSIKKKQIKK